MQGIKRVYPLWKATWFQEVVLWKSLQESPTSRVIADIAVNRTEAEYLDLLSSLLTPNGLVSS